VLKFLKQVCKKSLLYNNINVKVIMAMKHCLCPDQLFALVDTIKIGQNIHVKCLLFSIRISFPTKNKS
jgi:hypothetical protein